MATPAQPFLNLDSSVVDPETGTASIPWYQFFLNLWLRSGGVSGSTFGTVFINLVTNAGKNWLGVFDQTSGGLVGNVMLDDSPGDVEQVQTLGVSPFTFTASKSGLLMVTNGQIEFSRNQGTTWRVFSLVGSLASLRANDMARVTWFGANAPTVVWFPDQ